MTSTNDGKDVKSNQTSCPKDKTYYIGLYKSLDSRLNSECELRTRCAQLCEAWRSVHTLCAHSAPSTHPHLIVWIQRHTARTVLQSWQSPNEKDEQRAQIEEAIDGFVAECHDAITARQQLLLWEQTLLTRAQQLKDLLQDPWGHPVLKALLDPKAEQPDDQKLIEWLKSERGVVLAARLRQLALSKCVDLALALITAVMEPARRLKPSRADADLSRDITTPQPENGEPSFESILTTEAGFERDVWDFLTDMEFVLLHKSDKDARLIELAKHTALPQGFPIVERLLNRLDSAPREKKIWRNAKDVAMLIAQVVIARCMVVPLCAGAVRGALYRCSRALVRGLPAARLHKTCNTLAAPAATARHLHTLASAVHAAQREVSADLKPFVVELYVRAITFGMNELEKLKLKPEKEKEARATEQTLASWFIQLGQLMCARPRLEYECILTAFSVHPSTNMYDRIKSAPDLPPVDIPEPQKEDTAVTSEFGSWANDSRSMTNFVKTSETLNLKQSQHQANVLSTALLTEGEMLGLEAELCQDIAVLLSGPRVKTLSWDMDRVVLLSNCVSYMERTHGGTRAVTTELKYLNLDPAHWQHLPEEADDEDDLYYGIEKGYEHHVEIEPQPEEIWEDAMYDTERTSTAPSGSEGEAPIRRKKKTKPRRLSSESDTDPLSLVAENKRTEKKERPHSKERSKKKSDKRKQKKEKKKEKKDKDKVNPNHPMSHLIGLKVAKATDVPGLNEDELKSEENVVYDGHFSMDELKSPDKTKSDNKMTSKLAAQRIQAVTGLQIQTPIPTTLMPSPKSSQEMKEEVKKSIAKLLHFRRQKAEGNAPNSCLTSPDQSQTPKAETTPSPAANMAAFIGARIQNTLNFDPKQKHEDKNYAKRPGSAIYYPKNVPAQSMSLKPDVQQPNVLYQAQEPAQRKSNTHLTCYQEFLKQWQQKSEADIKAEAEEKRKKPIPATRVTPVIPEAFQDRQTEAPLTPSAKPVTQQKKADAASTYARLNYMHKNKQSEKPKAELNLQNSVSEELDRRIDELRKMKMATAKSTKSIPNVLSRIGNTTVKTESTMFKAENVKQEPKHEPKVEVQKIECPKPLELANDNPTLISLLNGSSVSIMKSLNESHPEQNTPSSPKTNNLTDKDHQDIMMLLGQQSKLNEPMQPKVGQTISILHSQTKIPGVNQHTTQPKIPGVSQPMTKLKMPGVNQPTTQPKIPGVNQPMTQPKMPVVSHPTTQPKIPGGNQPMTQPKIPGGNQPMTQPKIPCMDQPMTQSKRPGVNQPTTQSKIPGVNPSTTQPKIPIVNQPTTQPIIFGVNQQMAQPKIPGVNKSTTHPTVNPTAITGNVIQTSIKAPLNFDGTSFQFPVISNSTILKTTELIQSRRPKKVTQNKKKQNLVGVMPNSEKTLLEANKAATEKKYVPKPPVIIPKLGEEKPEQDWTKVLDALRSQKTPSRGPLDLAIKKDKSDEIQQRLDMAKERANLVMKINNTMLTQCTTSEVNVVDKTKYPQPSQRKYNTKKQTQPKKQSRPNQLLLYPEVTKQPIQPALQKNEDPFISGIRNSDYEILEELMDDDLRKEIGELSSDEDNYRSATVSSKAQKPCSSKNTVKPNVIVKTNSEVHTSNLVLNVKKNINLLPTQALAQKEKPRIISNEKVDIRNLPTAILSSVIRNATNVTHKPQEVTVLNKNTANTRVVNLVNSQNANNTQVQNTVKRNIQNTGHIIQNILNSNVQNTSNTHMQNDNRYIQSTVMSDIQNTSNSNFQNILNASVQNTHRNAQNIASSQAQNTASQAQNNMDLSAFYNTLDPQVQNMVAYDPYTGMFNLNESYIPVNSSITNVHQQQFTPVITSTVTAILHLPTVVTTSIPYENSLQLPMNVSSTPQTQLHTPPLHPVLKDPSPAKNDLQKPKQITPAETRTTKVDTSIINAPIATKIAKVHVNTINRPVQHNTIKIGTTIINMAADIKKVKAATNKNDIAEPNIMTPDVNIISSHTEPILNKVSANIYAAAEPTSGKVDTNVTSTHLESSATVINPELKAHKVDANKPCERKVLSEVQENLKVPIAAEKLKDVKEQERVTKKRQAIQNRNIHHRSLYPPIPLTYTPLKNNETEKPEDPQVSKDQVETAKLVEIKPCTETQSKETDPVTENAKENLSSGRLKTKDVVSLIKDSPVGRKTKVRLKTANATAKSVTANKKTTKVQAKTKTTLEKQGLEQDPPKVTRVRASKRIIDKKVKIAEEKEKNAKRLAEQKKQLKENKNKLLNAFEDKPEVAPLPELDPLEDIEETILGAKIIKTTDIIIDTPNTVSNVMDKEFENTLVTKTEIDKSKSTVTAQETTVESKTLINSKNNDDTKPVLKDAKEFRDISIAKVVEQSKPFSQPGKINTVEPEPVLNTKLKIRSNEVLSANNNNGDTDVVEILSSPEICEIDPLTKLAPKILNTDEKLNSLLNSTETILGTVKIDKEVKTNSEAIISESKMEITPISVTDVPMSDLIDSMADEIPKLVPELEKDDNTTQPPIEELSSVTDRSPLKNKETQHKLSKLVSDMESIICAITETTVNSPCSENIPEKVSMEVLKDYENNNELNQSDTPVNKMQNDNNVNTIAQPVTVDEKQRAKEPKADVRKQPQDLENKDKQIQEANSMKTLPKVTIESNASKDIDQTIVNKDVVLKTPKTNNQYCTSTEAKDVPQSYKDSIQITEVPNPQGLIDPNKRVFRLVLPNKKAYKATIRGKMQVSFDTFFEDPALKKILLSGVTSTTRCTLNVQHIASLDNKIYDTQIQVFDTENKKIESSLPSNLAPRYINPEVVDTVNLISDDEDEIPAKPSNETEKLIEQKPQTLITESGTYKVKSMDLSLLAQHQQSLLNKISIPLQRCDYVPKTKTLVDALLEDINDTITTIDTEPNLDIIEIGDSSDEDDLVQKKSVENIDVLKNLLLKDLGVASVLGSTPVSSTPISEKKGRPSRARKSTFAKDPDMIYTDLAPLIEETLIEERSTSQNKRSKDKSAENKRGKKHGSINLNDKALVTKIIPKKCCIKLSRCDHMLTNELDDEIEIISSTDDDDDIPISLLSRSDSFSILNNLDDSDKQERDGSPIINILEALNVLGEISRSTTTSPVMEVYDMIAVLGQATETPEELDDTDAQERDGSPIINILEALNELGEISRSNTTSPVMEVYDIIAALEQAPETPEESQKSDHSFVSCESEWRTTKRSLHLLQFIDERNNENTENDLYMSCETCVSDITDIQNDSNVDVRSKVPSLISILVKYFSDNESHLTGFNGAQKKNIFVPSLASLMARYFKDNPLVDQLTHIPTKTNLQEKTSKIDNTAVQSLTSIMARYFEDNPLVDFLTRVATRIDDQYLTSKIDDYTVPCLKSIMARYFEDNSLVDQMTHIATRTNAIPTSNARKRKLCQDESSESTAKIHAKISKNVDFPKVIVKYFQNYFLTTEVIDTPVEQIQVDKVTDKNEKEKDEDISVSWDTEKPDIDTCEVPNFYNRSLSPSILTEREVMQHVLDGLPMTLTIEKDKAVDQPIITSDELTIENAVDENPESVEMDREASIDTETTTDGDTISEEIAVVGKDKTVDQPTITSHKLSAENAIIEKPLDTPELVEMDREAYIDTETTTYGDTISEEITMVENVDVSSLETEESKVSDPKPIDEDPKIITITAEPKDALLNLKIEIDSNVKSKQITGESDLVETTDTVLKLGELDIARDKMDLLVRDDHVRDDVGPVYDIPSVNVGEMPQTPNSVLTGISDDSPVTKPANLVLSDIAMNLELNFHESNQTENETNDLETLVISENKTMELEETKTYSEANQLENKSVISDKESSFSILEQYHEKYETDENMTCSTKIMHDSLKSFVVEQSGETKVEINFQENNEEIVVHNDAVPDKERATTNDSNDCVLKLSSLDQALSETFVIKCNEKKLDCSDVNSLDVNACVENESEKVVQIIEGLEKCIDIAKDILVQENVVTQQENKLMTEHRVTQLLNKPESQKDVQETSDIHQENKTSAQICDKITANTPLPVDSGSLGEVVDWVDHEDVVGSEITEVDKSSEDIHLSLIKNQAEIYESLEGKAMESKEVQTELEKIDIKSEPAFCLSEEVDIKSEISIKTEDPSSSAPSVTNEQSDISIDSVEIMYSYETEVLVEEIQSTRAGNKIINNIISEERSSDLDNEDILVEKSIKVVDYDETIYEENATVVYKDDSGVILKGIEYEDPEIGPCYVFPLTKDSDEIDANEVLNNSNRSIIEVIQQSDEELTVIKPKYTYSKRSLKRKTNMNDADTSAKKPRRASKSADSLSGKKYRKGKNIDTPKLTTASKAESNYSKDYKLIFDYVSTLKFSYSISFSEEFIDVPNILEHWPIKGPILNESLEQDENKYTLFADTESDDKKKIPDYLELSLVEEISANYNDEDYSNDNKTKENNFNKGFGEGSGRVIQNLNGGAISKFSAATLSDVKQSQPLLLSEDDSNNDFFETTQRTQVQTLKRFFANIELRDKVRSFFKNTTIELSCEMKKDKNYFPFDLYIPKYFAPRPIQTIAQVVQVGQLPVSASAQNPVTCDPRVTQVSDASPSQCSVENSPQDDSQQGIKTEYTELTTADLSMPLVEDYVQHANQNANIETQHSNNTSMSNENIPIQTELLKSEVKIELVEETPEEIALAENNEQTESNKHVNNVKYLYDTNNTDVESDMQAIFSSDKPETPEAMAQVKTQNGSTEKTDQIAHAMNAAGITTTSETITNTRAHALVNILSQKIRQGGVTTTQNATGNFSKTTSINAMALQHALAQILPPPLNQTSSGDNNQQGQNLTPQVLHIVQGKNASGNQITLVDSQQSVINAPNATPVLHIVQNKAATSVPTSNGPSAPQSNTFSGISLVDAALQQGGNQLLHIVNTGNQKNNNAGQLLKRVNLLTNLTNVPGSNEQKMVQFVCKSADGKAIQLNAPHQRSMVLRLQPIETTSVQTTPKPAENQDLSPAQNNINGAANKEAGNTQEIKSRSVYEENYAKFIQNSSNKPAAVEKSTSLPKFNQAFGKTVFQDGNQKQNEMNSNNLPSGNTSSENTECPPTENAINLDHIGQISSPPLLLRKSPAQTSQAQANLVQQIKQTIAPMNIQTMHGGVIYTRQIPVNIGGGQTINLITVPSTDLIDESGQKQVNQDIEPSIIKIVPQSQAPPNAEVTPADINVNDENGQSQPQPQPVLTQMRIKLPMLSKTPQMVSGARVVRPSFFQIQRNVIGGANQPVYQQLVLTAAPPLGQQTIRLPQARQIKVTDNQSSSESQMSSSTLEQLREFDMVLEQVKERSTGAPNSNSGSTFKLNTPSTDTTDSPVSASSTPTETTQVLYSIGSNQPLNVAYVNRKPAITTPTTSTFVRSPDSSGIADSPTSSASVQLPHTSTTESSSSETATQQKPVKVSSKSKSRPKSSSHPPNSIKINTVPPKTSAQKPLEDEQTTQRILYILAEYKEQVENSPDKDKPAPRRRSNPPTNPSGSSKRKKSSSSSRRPGGRDMSPVHGDDTCRTMGSEDSSCGTSQGDCTESCLESHSPQDSPRKVVRKLTFDQDPAITEPRPQPQRNVIVADGQTITVARGTSGKPATAVLMPANYILPVSMVKGGQQIAIVTNRGPKLLTVGGGEGGTTNALLLQRLIGPAGLKPVLTRPGVRHVRLPTAALHNLQAFNLATATTVQPPDSTVSPASEQTPPGLIETRAETSPWTDREEAKPDRSSSPDESEPWNLPSSADPHDYTYEETVRADNMDRTVLDPIQDHYSPDSEAQRIFDKMFDVDSKKSYIDSPRCAYDIDASDCDDKAYQVVQKKEGGSQRQTRLAHVSAAALRHKYAILEHELRLQKSLSEECEDLGVDSPSASELFPEAELLFAASPAQDHAPDTPQHSHTPQPTLLNQSAIQADMDDQIATDQLLARDNIPPPSAIEQGLPGLEDVGIVTVSEDMQAIALDQEEFARAHPNTTFHSEPPNIAEVQPFTISALKSRHITSTIFHSNRVPATVLMTAPQATVISQPTADNNSVKYADLNNMINSIPSTHTNNINLSSVLVKDDGLTRFDNILTDSRELHLSNTASAIVHSAGNATQVIRRVGYEDDKRERERFLMDEPDAIIAGDDAKMVAEDSSRDATLESMADDDNSSPERHAELFWESNSASERSESRRPMDFSSDSEKCCKSPSYDETNSTDSSGVGTHMRLDSVIKEARGIERSGSAGSSADDNHPPLRTYPPKRLYHSVDGDVERSLSGKTRAGERSPDSLEVRRRASGRGVVKRGCHCCNGSPAPQRPKKPRQRKPTMDFTN